MAYNYGQGAPGYRPQNPSYGPPGGGANAPPPHNYGTPPGGGYGGGPPPGYGTPPGGAYSSAPPQSSYSSGPPSYSGGATSYSGGPPPGGYGYPPPVGGPYSAPPPSGPPGMPPGMDPDLYTWFQTVDADRSGKITAVELREALLNNNWSHFNTETCRLLIGMFDSNHDGSIDINEFAALWKYVQEWKSCFDSFDKDRSGNIDAYELQQALQSFGYRLSMEFCNLCTRVFDRNDKRTMKFDDFIQCCVMLRSLTEGFKRLDTDRDGRIQINYEQFLELAIDNTL